MEAPDFERMDRRLAALKAFENFRRDLAQALPPQLPAPQPDNAKLQ
jgi:hypothetical protein